MKTWNQTKPLTLFVSAVIVLACIGARPLVPSDSTYVVNSTTDAVDADETDGICAAADGTCTLRAAVMQANFGSVASTIILPAGTFTLTIPGSGENKARAGDLDVSEPVTIQGAGEGQTIIDGNGQVTGDRVFQILTNALPSSLQGMTIRNGSAPGIENGGGVLVSGTASALDLNLTDVTIAGNTATAGGGLYAATGTVILQNATVRDNTATFGLGGGIYAGTQGGLSVRDSQVYGNTALYGGGVGLDGPAAAEVTGSQVYANTAAADGGGIYASISAAFPSGFLSVVDSSLQGNTAGVSGGGISALETVTLLRTTVDGNQAKAYGGGIFADLRGSADAIQESTLSRNIAVDGGGIYFLGSNQQMNGILKVKNSTLSGNHASNLGGGIYAAGPGEVQLVDATIASNFLEPDEANTNPVNGGGVFSNAMSISALSSLIGDNTAVDPQTMAIQPDDCYLAPGTAPLNSLGWNLIETPLHCPISGNTATNILGQDPSLGPLAFNFGQIKTQALLDGSPAIDAGPGPTCSDVSKGGLLFDQRGYARPYGAACDIGAYEFYPVFSSYLPLVAR